MRVMVIVKATKEHEAGQRCSQELMAEMDRFNEKLKNAGVFLSIDGLQPSSKGARVKFSSKDRTVIDGPFAETRDLVGGFWIWKVASLEEATEWLKRAPFQNGEEVEIRPLLEPWEMTADPQPKQKEAVHS